MTAEQMDGLKINAEVAWIRTRGWLHLGVQLLGLALVFLAVFNLAAPAFTSFGAVAPYRAPIVSTLQLSMSGVFIADLAVLGVGLVLAWWG